MKILSRGLAWGLAVGNGEGDRQESRGDRVLCQRKGLKDSRYRSQTGKGTLFTTRRLGLLSIGLP